MLNRKLLFPLVCLVFCCSTIYSQDAPSLGEIARRARAEKHKDAATTGAAAAPAPSTSAQQAAPSAASPAKPTGGQTLEEIMHLPPGIPAGGALNFVEGNQEAIRQLFEQEQFKSIDMIADRARSTKQRFPGGVWYLHILYEPLSEPKRGAAAGEAEWKLQFDHLKRWVEQNPNSVTARVALAGAYQQYAWKARGNGYADTVSEEGWRLFEERLQLAGKTLAEAFALPTKCPEWYLSMQLLTRDLRSSREVQAAAFEKAIAFEPDYQYYYRAQAESLEPKWGGEEGELASFTEKVADHLGGKRGDIIYFLIASYINCNCGEDEKLHGLSFQRIKRGYMALEELHGVSLANLNRICYMAAAGGDPLYAHELFGRIADNWDPNIWKTRQYFDTARDWAQAWAAGKVIEDAMKVADENVKTPEGSKFDGQIAKAFAASYSTAVSDCLKTSGDSFLIPFDLVIRVAKDGSIEQIYSSVTTHVSLCLSPQVQKAKFPSPPQPSYWVKVHLQPSAEEIRKMKAAGLIR